MKTYEIAGTIIGVESTSLPILNAIDTMFCLCPPSTEQPTLHIRGRSCNFDDLVHALPEWLTSTTLNLNPSPEPFFISNGDGSAVVIKHAGSVCCAWITPDRPCLEFLASMRINQLTPLSVQPAIVPLLRELLLQKRQILLHSAAICCPDGTGALISAPGYGGKSTTTMAMLRLGAKLLGDDLTIIPNNKHQVHALGIPEPFNLTSQTLAFFPECQGIAEFVAKPYPDSKKVFSPNHIYGPDCLIADSPVHVAYFVRIDPNGPAIRRMNTTEAMQNFAAAHMFARNQLINGYSTTRLLDIISHLKVYELHTGPTPVQLGHWLMANIPVHALGDNH